MANVAKILVLLVAGIHFLFAYKEFTGRNSPDFYAGFEIKLAADQDVSEIGRIVVNAALFNALLGCGLLFSLAVSGGRILQQYLLLAIVIAGIAGGVTLKPVVALLQGGPALVALILVSLSKSAPASSPASD